MSIVPIKGKRVGDEVLEQIKDNIISGEWAPGAKIPGENVWCQQGLNQASYPPYGRHGYSDYPKGRRHLRIGSVSERLF